ncbi:type II secretion system protein GspE, partial [bacterium]|nr:type II secretion system protein GspE [bacterium]
MSLRKKELEELLIENGLITERQLSRAQDQAAKTGDPVTKILVGMGFVTDKDITEMMGIQLNVDFVDLDNMELNPDIVKTIPDNLAKRYNVIAVDLVDNRIRLAMADPADILAIDDIRLVTGYDIEPVIATESSLKKVIGTQFGSTDLAEVEDTVKDISAADFGDMEVDDNAEEEVSLDELTKLVDEAPIVRVVNLIISQAINDKSSDIHIEPD